MRTFMVSGLLTSSIALCVAIAPASAQSPRQQAEKELALEMPAGNVQACSLITRADVKNATGREPYVSGEIDR